MLGVRPKSHIWLENEIGGIWVKDNISIGIWDLLGETERKVIRAYKQNRQYLNIVERCEKFIDLNKWYQSNGLNLGIQTKK